MGMLFNNIEKLNEKEFMGFLSGQKILEQWEKNNITYIPEIQRGNKIITSTNGEKIEVPIFSQSNVNKIKKAILDGDFFVSQLTLNVTEDDAVVDYDPETRQLTIEGGTLAISDGQHRIRALQSIREEQSNYGNNFDLSSIIFPVKITNYNQEKAQQQFYQFTLGTKISSSRSEYFNHRDYANRICSDLNKDSVLSGKIETIKNIISKNDSEHIVSFATLKNSIELNFNTERYVSSDEQKETSKYLKEFFIELLNVVPEFNDYDARLALKQENSLLCENFTFYGYLAIAEHIQYKEDWRSSMQYIREMVLTKDQQPWIGNVIKKNIKKSTSKNGIQKDGSYNIINNSQSRKEMATLMLKYFKKIVKKHNDELEYSVPESN